MRPLLICEFLNLRLKGAVIAKRLVKQRLDGDSSTMGSAQSAILFKKIKIAPGCNYRNGKS